MWPLIIQNNCYNDWSIAIFLYDAGILQSIHTVDKEVVYVRLVIIIKLKKRTLTANITRKKNKNK